MTEDLVALAGAAVRDSRAQADPDLPFYHVVPPVGRLNDPNGLLVDGDTYHAFYQFSPLHPRKLVYWGHASSTDLATWTHHEPAIVPSSRYDRNGAYSGSGLVLEPGELPADPPVTGPYVLSYTGNVKDEVTGEREATQCLVTSSDLVTFTKYPGNPVIAHQPEGYTAHFRDPQVWRDRDDPAGSFRMLLGAQREDLTGAALFYRSEDLLTWTYEGELTFPDAGGAFDAFGYMWECPALLRVPDEDTGRVHDVLVWCPQGIEPETEGYETVFPCVYTVGHLVGTELRGCQGTFAEVDRGFEFYAPQVFARRASEPGPVLMTGWAGNAGEDDQPSIASGGWVHTLTVPRALSVRDGQLVQRPVLRADGEGSSALDAATLARLAAPGGGEVALPGLAGSRSWQLALEVVEGAPRWGLRIGSEDCHVDVRLVGDTLVVDRSTSRYTQHGTVRTVTLPAGAALRLEVLHDRSVTEIVLGDGDLALTLRSFVEVGSSGVRVLADGPLTVVDGRVLRRD